MWFRLAKELGMSVKRCQEEVDSAEFGEWVALYGIEPFGSLVESANAGTIAAVIANVNRGKDTKPYKPSDFMPWLAPPKADLPPPSAESMSLAVFGVDLRKLKKDKAKVFVLKRPPAARSP